MKIQLGYDSSITVKDGEPLPHGTHYPIVYYTDDSATLCPDCATAQLARNSEPDAIVCHGENIIGADVLEGSARDHGIVDCADCGKSIIALDSDEWECTCGAIHALDEDRCPCGGF